MTRKSLTLIAILTTALSLVAACTPKSKITYKSGKVVSCSSIPRFVPDNTMIPSNQVLRCLDGSASEETLHFKGPVVVNVWGSWCGPCEQEMKYFRALAATNKVKIVGVDVEEANMKMPRQFIVRQGMTWPSLFDPDGRTRAFFGMGVPVTWFIDATGAVDHKHIGGITAPRQLNDLVYRYLGIRT